VVGGSPPAVAWLYIDDTTPGADLRRWLENALPECAWSSHVVVAGTASAGPALAAVTRFLKTEPLAIVHLHLVINEVDGRADDELMRAAEAMQNEAYRERTGSRLVPLPILAVPGGTDPGALLEHAKRLAGRMAKPSLLMTSDPDHRTAVKAADLGLRIYLGYDEGDPLSVLGSLTAAHVVDSALDRLERPGDLIAPCRPHLVLHRGRVFGCAQWWRRLLPVTDPAAIVWAPNADLCAGCVADAFAGSANELRANLRADEGRELGLRLSAALVEASRPTPAAEIADIAASLSGTDDGRSAALVQVGLCRLAAGQLPEADGALAEAGRCGADAGLIAYHRAQVQVAWRDDIEALDLFADALDHGVDAVSSADLHLEMALSHIRLEEWSDARTHLERAGGPSPEIAFNLGVCDVNEDRAETALEHFDTALALGPPEDDLGRVLFFRGYCLKQLERYDEAVDDLGLSIELEQPEPEHHNLLGYCLFKTGRHTEAVAAFERAVALDPSSAVDWANLGVNLERLGDTERAAEMYRRALGMDPSIGFAAEGLARLTDER
jgi:tetratricopeptide (TPR) repeat protein